MAENSKIEWTDHTFNPWIGCTKVSPGCAHCYAETQDKFRSWTPEGWGMGKPRRRASPAMWKQPLKWNHTQFAECMNCQRRDEFKPGLCPSCDGNQFRPIRPRVFCASLADWLDDEVPIEWLADLLLLIRETPNLDWLLLTKRPQNWAPRIKQVLASVEYRLEHHDWLSDWRHGVKAPGNVWIGTSVEDQQRADERIPHLLSIPARVRFLSCEPLLGQVDLSPYLHRGSHLVCPRCLFATNRQTETFCPNDGAPLGPDVAIQWIIAGGESGPNARPMHPDWARTLRNQCAAAGVPFLFKQWGESAPYEPPYMVEATAKELKPVFVFHPPGMTHVRMERVGKKSAGRTLDGLLHTEFPVAQP